MKFVTNLNLNQNELQNGKFQVVASDPSVDNFEGRLIYNSTEKTIKVYTGSAWRKMLHTVSIAGDASAALTQAESNGTITLTPVLATTSANGVMSSSDKTKLDDATADATASKLVIRDASGNAKVATPTDSGHIATKGYVDSARQGLDVKASVRAATTAAINLATDLEAGDAIDGVTLVAGDRVLVKNQVTDSENGIYVAVASGAASRSTDANGTADTGELTSGTFTFVEEGTVNFDSGFVVSTNGTISVGSTGITWTQFSGAGSFDAGDGLSKSGTTVNVNVGTGIEISSDALRISSDAAGDGLGYSAGVLSVTLGAATGLETSSDAVGIKLDSAISGLATTSSGLKIKSDIAGDGITYTAGVLSRDVIDLGQGSDDTTGTLPVDQGGTGAVTESDARTSLATTTSSGMDTSTPVLARVSSKAIGDGAATSYTITHNFNTRAVLVQVYDSSTYETVIADVSRTNVNAVTVAFSVAPASNAYTVVVTG
jgi:hypothetical protein